MIRSFKGSGRDQNCSSPHQRGLCHLLLLSHRLANAPTSSSVASVAAGPSRCQPFHGLPLTLKQDHDFPAQILCSRRFFAEFLSDFIADAGRRNCDQHRPLPRSQVRTSYCPGAGARFRGTPPRGSSGTLLAGAGLTRSSDVAFGTTGRRRGQGPSRGGPGRRCEAQFHESSE
jgi:hypothetical protein